MLQNTKIALLIKKMKMGEWFVWNKILLSIKIFRNILTSSVKYLEILLSIEKIYCTNIFLTN